MSMKKSIDALTEYKSLEEAADQIHDATDGILLTGILSGKTQTDLIFLVGENEFYQVPQEGIVDMAESTGCSSRSGIMPSKKEVSALIRNGTKIRMVSVFEVGKTLVPHSPSDQVLNDDGTKSVRCNPGCFPCPNGSCCCAPFTRCLRAGCAR